MTLTLAGLQAVDVGRRAATAWCSRLLADYGAEVMMVEPAGGHELRFHPPFGADGRSTTARYFLANKRTASPSRRRELIEAADVIVTDRDAQALARDNPRAVICAITATGLANADQRGNELTAYASSGWASVNGMSDQPPLKGSGYQAAYQAGTLAYGAIVAALIERGNGDAGQIIDISEREVLVSTFAPAVLRAQYSGIVWQRRERVTMNDGPVPVADGYFALPLSRPAFWRKAMTVLGLPDLADDEELQQPGLRLKHVARFANRTAAAMSNWRRTELFDALAAERVVAGPAFTIDEMGDNPQFRAREFFRTPEENPQTRFPGPYARMSESGWRLAREMPDATTDSGFVGDGLPELRPHRAGSEGDGPLAGFRGLVLTQAWAGTYATELLALCGAEVIQLETRGRLDSWRGTYHNPIPKRLHGVETATHAWNCNPLYNSVNLNKQCITVDLATSAGVELFQSLLPHMDFVAENFSPRVMAKLGLAYDTLKAIKPDLVMASLSAYGATGPWANVPGIGGTIEPSSGMSSLLGYEGGAPQNSGQMYPDPVAGICGFAAIATALLHRDRTGLGQYIDLSMQEANFTFIGDAWLEFEVTGHARGPLGNRHPLYAPHAIYPCAGEDQWIAIAAETEAQFVAIAGELAFDPASFSSNAERKTRENELDARIAAHTTTRDKHSLANRLAALGVPAAPVLDAGEIVLDAQLRRRGHLVRIPHPETGPMWQSAAPLQFSRTPLAVNRPAPLQGEHSRAVFRRFLNMSDARYQELTDRGVTGRGPPD